VWLVEIVVPRSQVSQLPRSTVAARDASMPAAESSPTFSSWATKPVEAGCGTLTSAFTVWRGEEGNVGDSRSSGAAASKPTSPSPLLPGPRTGLPTLPGPPAGRPANAPAFHVRTSPTTPGA